MILKSFFVFFQLTPLDGAVTPSGGAASKVAVLRLLHCLSKRHREWIRRAVQCNPVSPRLTHSVVRHGDRREPPLRYEPRLKLQLRSVRVTAAGLGFKISAQFWETYIRVDTRAFRGKG